MMRKLLVSIAIYAFSADFPLSDGSATKAGVVHSCTGYTIIEWGKAIDCRGDTIRLIRRHGIQMAVAGDIAGNSSGQDRLASDE